MVKDADNIYYCTENQRVGTTSHKLLNFKCSYLRLHNTYALCFRYGGRYLQKWYLPKIKCVGCVLKLKICFLYFSQFLGFEKFKLYRGGSRRPIPVAAGDIFLNKVFVIFKKKIIKKHLIKKQHKKHT